VNKYRYELTVIVDAGYEGADKDIEDTINGSLYLDGYELVQSTIKEVK
jgi:hypothetical protein